MAGRLGTAELGALGLAVAILGAATWAFNFLVYGTTATVARASGAGDLDRAGRRVAHAAQLALALGAVAAVVLVLAAPLLVRGFGAVDRLVEPATTYLRVRAVGVPFLLLGYVGHGAFRGVADTRTPLVVVAVANVLNGALDVLLVFGLGMGVAGIAWATVAAEVTAVVAFLVLLGRAGLPLRGHGRAGWRDLRMLVTVSRDLFLRTGALLLGLLAVTSAAARVSAVTAAAHQVLWQVWIIVSFLLDGFAIAGQALVGTALGAGRPDAARRAARDLLVWGVGGGAAIAVVVLALVGPLPRLLTDEPAVLDAARDVWWLAAGGHVLNGTVFVLDGVFMGAGDFGYLRTWTIVAAAVAAAGAQLAVPLGGDLLALWLALEAMMVVRLASLLWRLRGRAWLTTGERLPSA